MRLAEDNDVVQTLTPDRSDQPFGKAILPRRGRCGGLVPDAHGAHPPSQGWRTFIRNHADGIAAMYLFVVPTISFRLLYGLLIMGHGRRHILWFGVTAHPT